MIYIKDNFLPTELYKELINYCDDFKKIETISSDAEIFNTSDGIYEFRVFSFNALAQPSRTPAELTFSAIGKTAPPSDITNLTYEPISDKEIRLRWDAVPDQDVRAGGRIHVRHSPKTDGSANFSDATDLVFALSGASNVSGVAGYTNVLTSDNNSDVSSLQMRVENYITKKTIENQFLPLVLSPKANGEICWNNSRLNHTNLPAVLFWLDMLSISNKVSLNAFEIEDQHLLLEAALSPDKTRECARQISKNVSASIEKISVYLGEIERNNEFISFIARATPRFTLDIGGVMLNGEERYIQTMDGRRFNEGSAPDLGSRIASVGELGILILLDDKLETVIYGQNLNWKSNGDLSRL